MNSSSCRADSWELWSWAKALQLLLIKNHNVPNPFKIIGQCMLKSTSSKPAWDTALASPFKQITPLGSHSKGWKPSHHVGWHYRRTGAASLSQPLGAKVTAVALSRASLGPTWPSLEAIKSPFWPKVLWNSEWGTQQPTAGGPAWKAGTFIFREKRHVWPWPHHFS